MLDAASDPAVPYPRLLQDASLLPGSDAIESGAARILRALLRSRSGRAPHSHRPRRRTRLVRARAYDWSRGIAIARPVPRADAKDVPCQCWVCSDWRLAVKRCALGRWAALAGDSGAGHSLGGGDVGPGARRVGDGDGDVLLQPGMPGGVIGGAVLPAAPEDAAPGAAEGSQRAAVVVAAGSGLGVEVSRPRIPSAGVDRERA